MTKEKVQLFKDMYLQPVKHRSDPNRQATLGEYVRIVLDGGIEFNTQLDFLIFDDDNELLHIICANDDPYLQYDFPFKIMSAPYEIIFVIESVVTKDNLNTILDSGFIGNCLSSEKKEFIKKWMPATNANHKPNPMDAEPFYKENARTEHNETKIIPRDDGVKIAVSPASIASKSVVAAKTKESFVAAINNAEPGATVALAANIELSETLKITKPITIKGTGKTITSSAKNAIELYADAEIMGLNITNNYNGGRCINTRANVNVMLEDCELITSGTGNNQTITVGGSTNGTTMTIKECTVNAGESGYGIIAFVDCDIDIEDSEIEGYSAVYMKKGSEGSTIGVKHSSLYSTNNHSGADDTFGTIVFETGDIAVTVNDSSYIGVNETAAEADQYIFLIQNSSDNINISIKNGTSLEGDIILVDDGLGKIYNNKIVLNQSHIENIINCGLNTMKYGSNMIQITDYSEASVNGKAYEHLADAIANANDGDTVTLSRNVITSDMITVDKNITIDGEGCAVISNANKAFEIYSDAAIKNIAIRNETSNGRCVDTRKAVNLKLEDVYLHTSGTGNNQTITVGGSENGTSITINGSTVGAGKSGYGIIAFVECNIDITNTCINGFGAIYMKPGSDNSIVNVHEGSILRSFNHDKSSRFGTIVSEADGVSVSVEKYSELTAECIDGTYQDILLLSSYNGTVVDNMNVTIDDGVTLNGKFMCADNGILNNNITIPKKYETLVWESGFATETVEAGVKVVENASGITVHGVSCSTIEDAIANAEEGETVYISNDINSTNIIKVDKPIAIDGGNKTVTCTAKKAFEIYADAKIENMKIDNTSAGGRCIDTRTKANVNLKSVTLNTNSAQNNQPITIGGSENGTVLVLEDSKINAGVAGYGIIAFVECNVTVSNTEINGYNAVYMKSGSNDSEITISDSVIKCENPHKDPSSHFGVFVLESDSSVVKVNNCDVTTSPVEGQLHEIVVLSGDANDNIIVFDTSAELSGDIIKSSNDSVRRNIIKLSDVYAENVVACGYSYEENDEIITIKDPELIIG